MEKRLQRLERSNRRLKLGSFLAAICVAAIGAVGAKQMPKQTVEANEFVLRGPDGHVRATLSADSTEGRLVFLDDSRKIKGILAADRLVFADLSGNARIALRPDTDGGTLIINGHGGYGVELARDSARVGLYMNHGQGDSLAVSIEKNGDLLQNGPAIELSDKQGSRTIIGQAALPGKATTPVSSLLMLGKDDRVIWSAP
jgi:hypothetical protein